MTDLSIVNDSQGRADEAVSWESTEITQIPNFEGEEVVATLAKITSVAGLEIEDRVFRMDETVRLVIEARVVDVGFKPNSAGKLVRVHLLKAIDSMIIDWAMDMDGLREALR